MTKFKDIIKNLDKPLLIMTVILLLFGLVMIFSASNVTAYMNDQSAYNYFFRQAIFLIVSFIISIVVIRFNTKAYGMLSYLLLLIVGIALVLVLFYGIESNNAHSWFAVGPITIQPSEFAKIIMIVFMARYYEVNSDKLNRWTVSVVPLIIGAILTFLIVLQPDLGTAILFVLLVGLIFFITPIPVKVKGKIVLGGIFVVMAVALFLLMSGKSLVYERQLERFDFRDPCSRLLDTGNQVCNGYIALNNGGLTGVGLGNSTQKYLYLPEPYTDFIFAVIVEELGAIVGILLLLSFLFVLYRIIKIGRESYTNRGAIICYGVAIYLFLQIVVNLMGLLGLMPLTGVPLPFVSYGGSFTLCSIVALTFVQRVNIETKLRNGHVKMKKNKFIKS